MTKFIDYTRYFYYIARNWNFQLAFFSIYHEVRGEIKYRVDTSKLNDLRELTLTGGNIEYAEIYQGANYYLLENIFRQLQKLKADGGFVDIGCGKGRVLVVAGHYGFNKITGIDFASQLCLHAIRNCKQLSKKYPSVCWQVLLANAASFRFEIDHCVFFLFNPFRDTVMRKVISNILESVERCRRKIFVVYLNPQCKQLFLEAGFKQIYFIRKMQFVEASILEKGL